MGLYINQQNTRTKLQEKIAADLRAKAAQNQDVTGDPVDGVEDSAYIQGTRQTKETSRIWVLVILLFLATIVILATAK